MTIELCRFRDFAVPLLGLSTRYPSIHEMRVARLVDSSFRAPHLPDAAGTRLCLGTADNCELLVAISLFNRACQLAVFSGKLPFMEAEIDDKLPSNSR